MGFRVEGRVEGEFDALLETDLTMNVNNTVKCP